MLGINAPISYGRRIRVNLKHTKMDWITKVAVFRFLLIKDEEQSKFSVSKDIIFFIDINN